MEYILWWLITNGAKFILILALVVNADIVIGWLINGFPEPISETEALMLSSIHHQVLPISEEQIVAKTLIFFVTICWIIKKIHKAYAEQKIIMQKEQERKAQEEQSNQHKLNQ